MKNPLFLPWLGNLLAAALKGFAHGAIVGGGIGASISQPAPVVIPTTYHSVIEAAHPALSIARSAIYGGLIGAGKDLVLFVNSQPMPNPFVATPPQAASQT